MNNSMPKNSLFSKFDKVHKHKRTEPATQWQIVADRAKIKEAHPDWTDEQVSDEMQRLTLESVIGPDYKSEGK